MPKNNRAAIIKARQMGITYSCLKGCMPKQKKKSFIGWIWKCEFNKVIRKVDGSILINDSFSPQTTASRLDLGGCDCGGDHPKQKILITIQEV